MDIIHGYMDINSVQGSGLLYTIIVVAIIEVFRFARLYHEQCHQQFSSLVIYSLAGPK